MAFKIRRTGFNFFPHYFYRVMAKSASELKTHRVMGTNHIWITTEPLKNDKSKTLKLFTKNPTGGIH